VGSPGFWITRYFATDSSGLPAIDCINDTTLTIRLKSAFAPFLQVLTLPYCKITAPEAISFYGKNFRKNPVGTGPFYAKFWKENELLVLLKNQNYFEVDLDGKKLPYLDAINIFFIKDRYTEFLEFKAGNLHMLPGIEGSYKDEILDKNGKLTSQFSNQFILYNAPFLKIDYLGFMLTNKDLPTVYQNKKIRKALNLAVDREAIIQYLRNNIGKSAENGFLPEGLPSYSKNDNAYSYNFASAKKLLIEEGFDLKNKKLPPITLSVTPGYSDIAEFLQSEWKKIGLDLKIEILPSNMHAQKSAKGELMFFRKSWIGDYPDAENFLNLFSLENFCPKGPNYTHFNNQLFEKILSESKLLTNNELRYEKYRQAESILLEESPIIPLYYDRAVKFCNKNIQGIEMNALNQIELKKVKFKLTK
jgi:peptide/nickel transport system substrate-binding protein